LGNKAFAAKSYDLAIQFFSQAIDIDPKNHVLYSNRSAAKAGKKQWNAALEDAEQVRQILCLCLFVSTLIASLIAQPWLECSA
jgi:tetratricopeptide (TPR) repeat protein